MQAKCYPYMENSHVTSACGDSVLTGDLRKWCVGCEMKKRRFIAGKLCQFLHAQCKSSVCRLGMCRVFAIAHMQSGKAAMCVCTPGEGTRVYPTS